MATVRFTDKWLGAASLTPEEGRTEYVDGLCPGLHFRVSANKVRAFSVVFRLNGKLTRRTIGRYPRVTLANARASALDVMRKAQEGVDAREHRSREESTLIYAELVEAYVQKHLKPNARSWKNVSNGLNHSRMGRFAKKRVADIRRRDVIDLIDEIVGEGKPQAAINQLRYLKMLFNWAAGRDMIVNSPCDGVKPPGRTVERDRVLSDAEIAAVWLATLSLPEPFGSMYRMLMLTGQRRNEVAEMRWREVVDTVWTIPRERVKKDRPHAVPLTKTALATLATLPRYGDDAFVFTTTGGKRPSSNFNKTKQQLDRLSGTSGWTIHDLRRTVRSKLAELRVPEVVARKVLNHEAGKVDRIYNRHEYLTEKREALVKWEKMLISLATKARHHPA